MANDWRLHRNSFPLKSGIIAVQAAVIRSEEPLPTLIPLMIRTRRRKRRFDIER
jgi:hypothetical protein